MLCLVNLFLNIYENQKNFSSKHDKFKAVDNCYTWLKFRNFYGSFWFSKNSSGQRNQLSIRIFGTKGAIKWEHSKPESLIFFDNDGNIKIIDRLNKNSQYINNNQFHTYAAGHPNGFLDAYDDFIDGYSLCDLGITHKISSLRSFQTGIKNIFGFTNPEYISNISGRLYYINLKITINN